MSRSSLSPTQRTLRELRNQGRVCGIVERFNAHVGPHGIRQDLFGFIDLISLDPERGIVGVQCTSGSNVSARRRKIIDERSSEARIWLQCGGRIEVWGWRKLGPRGKRKLWKPRREDITLADFGESAEPQE